MLAYLFLLLPVYGEQCFDFNGRPIPIDNERVIQMKHNTSNGYLDRGHISGVVGEVYAGKPTHQKFQARISGRSFEDTIEIIYNISFGKIPSVKTGMAVESCGDYITSNIDAKYKASPDLAILHWVHQSNGNHPDGWVRLNGVYHGCLSECGKLWFNETE